MLRWLDIDHSGTDHGLSIDDVTISYTVPTGGTTASFTAASSSIAENSTPATIGITITNPDPSNSTSVTVTASGATGRIGSFTSPVVAAGGATSVNLSVPIADNILCDGNQAVTFTITGVTGGQGTPAIGSQATHALTVNNDDVCTNVSFAVASQSVTENSTTYNVAVNITDFSTTQATSVEVALASGAAARINNYTTQTVTFPANSGTAQNVAITITNNSNCDGSEVLTFALQNVTGGQGTPTMGANRTLTITDDEVSAPPIATAATGVGSSTFTAHWNAISGATNYRLDVYTISPVPTTDLIISEYVEGSSNNKYVELYNGTGASVNLTNYRIRQYNNGSATPTSDVLLSGTLADGATIVYKNSSATIYGGAATNNAAMAYNGNDAVALFKISTSSNVDIIGRIGEDPGTAWTSGALTTVDKTLRRKSTVTAGVATNPGAGFPTLATEWDQFNIDDVTGLGAHTYSGTTTTYVSGYNNYNAGTNTSHTVTGLTPGTTYYYVVRATGGCAAAGNSNQITVATPAITDYYSRASGNVEDAIWSETPTGTAGFATWTGSITMNVQTGHTVTNVNSVTVGGVDVVGTLVLAGGSTLTINGDEFTSTGTITAADNSLVELFGENAIMSVTGTPSFFDITVNNSSSILADEPFGIRGTLFVEAGDFETLSTVTMQSDATGTGRLGPVGGTFTGDITMERYIPAGATNWRLLGSPVSGQTVNDWKDDFFTAGFPGSHYPNFFVPAGSGIFWPSIRYYDETVANASADTGLVGVTSNTQLLAQGQGFAAWCGDNLNSTTDFTIDVTGAPHIAQSAISLPVTYTNTGNAGADGYNLVSNPLPSPIRWSELDRTNVSGTAYIFNPAAGNTGVYIIGTGGTLGATDTIQSSQAFFVRATGASPSLQVDEADKVLARSYGGLFGGSQVNLFSGLHLRVSSGINQYMDETVVAFNMGAPDIDENDVSKIVFAHPDAPQIATRTESGVPLMVNAYGTYTLEIAIPVAVNVGVDGTYTITATQMENIGLSCLTLEDLVTGTITPLSAGASYSFTAGAADDAAEARFVLRATAPVPMITDNATCFGSDNGHGTVVHTGTAPMDITWTNAAGETILQQTISNGVAVSGALTPGEYGVRVNSNGACGDLQTAFTITEPAELEVLADYSAASCYNTADGLVDLTVLGGTAPYTYGWSNGSDTEDITVGAGTYTVEVTDVNGCSIAPQVFTIQSLDELQATGSVESNTVEVNTPLAFNATEVDDTTIEWNFGDESTSTEAAPTHSWSTPGTYTVVLTMDNGFCTSTWTTSVVVEMSTGIAPVNSATALNAWYANDKFVVEHGFNNGEAVVVEVLDATGRLHLTRKAAGVPARITLPADGLSTGVWFVRVSNAGSQRTVRVPLVR
ncbi:MAG: lamin tail domain-containing protein [Flavobacteriales bacterium]|nr:lamin tail domain-containing protein [Flavobacteriales bacterium]